jgi:hypothetical protein
MSFNAVESNYFCISITCNVKLRYTLAETKLHFLPIVSESAVNNNHTQRNKKEASNKLCTFAGSLRAVVTKKGEVLTYNVVLKMFIAIKMF